MAIFQESEAKKTIRLLIKDAAGAMQRAGLTYMGMPAEQALDILTLGSLLKNAICIDVDKDVLKETRLSIAILPLKEVRWEITTCWDYLRETYPSEPLVADVTFLDFYGGGIRTEDPFAEEIAGLRNYFSKHSRFPNRAFVFAWTYMPRDRGKKPYLEALRKLVLPAEYAILERMSGVDLRSFALRLLLRQILNEHNMVVNVFHHAVYKQVMNTIIILFSRGVDPQCQLMFKSPDSLLHEPYCYYSPGEPVPVLKTLLDQ
jgi:hypothetical protein